MAVVTENVYTFFCPSTITLSGPTSGGKTTFLKKLLHFRNIMFKERFRRIVYCYGTWQSLFNDMYDVEFVKGIPSDIENINSDTPDSHLLLIFDDLMDLVVKNEGVQTLFSRGSHHNNVTLIYVNQNFYFQGPKSRTISLNSQYIILFKNKRDKKQILHLASQMGETELLKFALDDIWKKKYSYLLIDLSPHNDSEIMVKTDIFPDEFCIGYK